MNKMKLTLISIALLVSTTTGYYYYIDQNTVKQHGIGVMDLSCSDDIVFSFRLKHNGTVLWTKTHKDFFSMPEAVSTKDRRFEGKNIVPLAALLAGYDNVKSITVTPCDGEKLSLNPIEIINKPALYYLSQNRKNRMKLVIYVGDQQYHSLKRNVIEVDLIE